MNYITFCSHKVPYDWALHIMHDSNEPLLCCLYGVYCFWSLKASVSIHCKCDRVNYSFNKLEFSLQSHDNVISVLDGHLILCASPIPIKSYLIKLNVKDPSSPLNVCQGLIGEDRHDICFEEMKWLAVSLVLREILFPSIGAEDKSAVSMDTSFQKLFRVITAINVYANVVLKFCHP